MEKVQVKEDNHSLSSTENNVVCVEFLYIDNDECDPCTKAETIVEEVVFDINKLLEETGVVIKLIKTYVDSVEHAQEVGLISSPTVRIDGKDLQMDIQEKYCETCSDISGEEINCRIWTYKEREYSILPKGMLIENILKHIYGTDQSTYPTATERKEVPENIKLFFEGKENKKLEKNKCGCSSSSCC